MSNETKTDDLFENLQRGLSDFGKKVGSFMDDVLSSEALSSDMKIRTDIYYTDKEFVLEIELPGMQKDKLGVQIIDGILQIKGDKKPAASDEMLTYQRQERQFGAFLKSYTLPEDINQESIKAKYDFGVLTIRFPLLNQLEDDQTPQVDID